MKRGIKKSVLPAALILVSACMRLDVVGRDAERSFEEVLAALPPAANSAGSPSWSLDAPDGAVSLVIARDEDSGPDFDAALLVDAEPFLAAGLDPSQFPLEIADGVFEIKAGLSDTASEPATPISVFKKIVENQRDRIGYHTALDHYNIDLGGGNMFEWAKDMSANDKDIVYVLDPAPFIAAGADPGAVDGWAFSKVPVDIDGKPAEVDKFLKAFDLE
ncbi:MAG: hypothetical protein LBS62_05570 [Clostridiales bacterium]|jgi:hypothetical protein|nr:hypothetical protein [Clostridiales bacterium]